MAGRKRAPESWEANLLEPDEEGWSSSGRSSGQSVAKRMKLFAVALALRTKKASRRVVPRGRKFRRDPKSTDWYKWLMDTRSSNPETREGKRFRRKFRVPPAEVMNLCAILRDD